VIADAKKDEGGVRLIAESIRKISDVIKEKSELLASADKVEYHSSGAAAVAAFCSKLSEYKYVDGGLDKAQVKLIIHSGEREILVELPKFFAINDNAREEILQLENVWAG
jgi:uncharacterized protein (UPF0264 family)